MPGYPDWQAYANQVGDAFQYGVAVTNASQDVDTLAISQWAGLDIYMFHPTLDCELTIAWITTTPTGNAVWEETFVAPANVETVYHVANHGGFAKLQVISTATAGTLNLRISPHNRPLTYQPAWGFGLLAGNNAEVIAGGAVSLHDLIPYRGPARLHINTNAAANTIVVTTQDIGGVVLGRLYTAGAITNIYEILYLPSLKNQLSITNGDGVNRTFRWSVTAIL